MAPTKLTFNTYVNDPVQLSVLQPTGVREIILEHQALSRWGTLNTDQLIELIHLSAKQGYSLSLQWDALYNEAELHPSIEIFEQLPLAKIHAVRVQDLGVAEFIRQEHPLVPLHLIVETGNHNLASLQQWCRYFGKQLQRLVLSTELSGKTLHSYCETLNTPCEILGLGRILLFYTPRALLQFLQPPNGSPLEKVVSSDEHRHHHFPTVQNQHGTFMFHCYDLFLLDLLPQLMKTKMQVLRLDFRFTDLFEWIQVVDHQRENFNLAQIKQLQSAWPVHTIHGFYRANRTERPIERLKNKHLQDHGEHLVASVVEVLKNKYIALLSRKPFSTNEPLLFITPEGKEVTLSPTFIQNTQGQAVESTQPAGIWLIPYHKWIVPKTLVYRSTPPHDESRAVRGFMED